MLFKFTDFDEVFMRKYFEMLGAHTVPARYSTAPDSLTSAFAELFNSIETLEEVVFQKKDHDEIQRSYEQMLGAPEDTFHSVADLQAWIESKYPGINSNLVAQFILQSRVGLPFFSRLFDVVLLTVTSEEYTSISAEGQKTRKVTFVPTSNGVVFSCMLEGFDEGGVKLFTATSKLDIDLVAKKIIRGEYEVDLNDSHPGYSVSVGNLTAHPDYFFRVEQGGSDSEYLIKPDSELKTRLDIEQSVMRFWQFLKDKYKALETNQVENFFLSKRRDFIVARYAQGPPPPLATELRDPYFALMDSVLRENTDEIKRCFLMQHGFVGDEEQTLQVAFQALELGDSNTFSFFIRNSYQYLSVANKQSFLAKVEEALAEQPDQVEDCTTIIRNHNPTFPEGFLPRLLYSDQRLAGSYKHARAIGYIAGVASVLLGGVTLLLSAVGFAFFGAGAIGLPLAYAFFAAGGALLSTTGIAHAVWCSRAEIDVVYEQQAYKGVVYDLPERFDRPELGESSLDEVRSPEKMQANKDIGSIVVSSPIKRPGLFVSSCGDDRVLDGELPQQGMSY